LTARRALGAALVIAIFVAAFTFVRWWDFALPSFGHARYQAVFLANGQTYFGRYVDRIGSYVKIDDAYYIQQSRTSDDDSTPPESKLIRRGNELHHPQPEVLIAKTAILFIEDLRPDSSMAQFMAKDSGR
jgi:hypothetical protein